MSWIWLADAPHAGDVFVFARRAFDAREGTAVMRLCADARYRAWLNGEPVGRGPIRSLPRDIAADAYEVPLRAGRNVLSVLARWYGRPTVHWLPGATARGGIWASLRADDLLVETDEHWRMRRAPYERASDDMGIVTEGMPDPELIDGRAWPADWLDADFDDAAWARATTVHGPTPGAHDLPAPVERLHVVGAAPEGTTTLDLGFITNAHIEVTLDGEGATVELHCGEEVDASGAPLDERDWRMRFTGGSTAEAFEPAGFRFVQARVTGGTATIRARERTYPRAEGAWFRCDDPVIEQIWHAGARTLDLCSTDAYIDCPSREQRAWLGDDIVNTAVSLVCNPDLRLVLHDLRLHAAGQREDGTLPMVAAGDFSTRAHTLPDANLHWIRTLARVFEHTGDVALLHELLPVSARILDHFESMRGPDDLLTGWRKGVDGWVFVDWAQIERGPSMAVMDALHGIALTDHATMCEALGWRADASAARERAERTRRASEAYWDEHRGAYVDATKRISQQTNAAAIVAGWPSPDRAARIIERICDDARLVVTKTPGDGGTLGERLAYQFQDPDAFDDEQNVVAAQPYFCHLLHEALAMQGRHDLLVRSIRRWESMVARSGTVEEYWDAQPGLGSRCHSWAATPTYDLVRHILGVRIRSGEVTAEPNLGGLSWAEARVATPRGWVVVRADGSGSSVMPAPP